MSVIIQEKKAKSILIKTGIPGSDFCINPYIGCCHSCAYCYATFMKKYTGHTERWGTFVDIKVNAPEVLERQVKRASRGKVIMSSVTDAYQPVEARYRLTRRCLEVLLDYQYPVGILTKSPLVLRDMDLIRQFKDIEVGITITTDDDRVRKMFEPKAPPVDARIKTLKTLHDSGIATYAFIGPVLPMNPAVLAERIRPYADNILVDRMNYVSKTRNIFLRNNLGEWLDRDFTGKIIERLKKAMKNREVSVC